MSGKRSFEGKLNRIMESGAVYKIAAFLIIIGLLIGTYSANQSYAWFTDTQGSEYELVSGKVHYKLEIKAREGFMIPGKDLMDSIALKNLSTIDTDARIKLEYTVWTTSGGIAVSSSAVYVTNASITGAADDQYLELTAEAGSDLTAQKLTVDGREETWWANTQAIPAIAVDAAGTGTPVDIKLPFSKLCYYGPKTGNIFAGRDVVLKITLQAKQREHVAWDAITVFEKFEGSGI